MSLAFFAPQAQGLLHGAVGKAEQLRVTVGAQLQGMPGRHDKDVVFLEAPGLFARGAAESHFTAAFQTDMHGAVGAAHRLRLEARWQPLRPEGDALARYGANMLPLDYQPQPADPTRVFVYPFERSRASLLSISKGTPDAHHGFKLRYVNPATGASPMPTIGTFAQRLPAGFETKPLRSTDGTVHVCLEGGGEARLSGPAGDQTWRFHENDVFVVPSWHALQLRADRDTQLFSFSDRPVQQALGLWREERQ